jgi:hypothetical protein
MALDRSQSAPNLPVEGSVNCAIVFQREVVGKVGCAVASGRIPGGAVWHRRNCHDCPIQA